MRTTKSKFTCQPKKIKNVHDLSGIAGVRKPPTVNQNRCLHSKEYEGKKKECFSFLERQLFGEASPSNFWICSGWNVAMRVDPTHFELICTGVTYDVMSCNLSFKKFALLFRTLERSFDKERRKKL